MRRFRFKTGFFLFLAVTLISVGFYLISPVAASYISSLATTTPRQVMLTGPLVEIAGVTVPVDLATTSPAIKQGLSGRKSLPAERGLLFIFHTAYRYAFWMPDMHFPIDIIWIADGRVVDVDENVSPKFNPANPIFYRPLKPVDRVLEVNAGWFARHQLRVGDQVSFKNIE